MLSALVSREPDPDSPFKDFSLVTVQRMDLNGRVEAKRISKRFQQPSREEMGKLVQE